MRQKRRYRYGAVFHKQLNKYYKICKFYIKGKGCAYCKLNPLNRKKCVLHKVRLCYILNRKTNDSVRLETKYAPVFEWHKISKKYEFIRMYKSIPEFIKRNDKAFKVIEYADKNGNITRGIL